MGLAAIVALATFRPERRSRALPGDDGMEPAKIRRAYVNGPYGQMHVRIAGGGRAYRPLICFHLSPLSGVVYENWISEMGRDRMAVAIDTPGYGMSDHPPQPPTIAEVTAHGAHVVFEGAIPAQAIEDAARARVLFICTGNTCRSPMTASLCRKLLSDHLGCAPAPARHKSACMSDDLHPNFPTR